MEAISLNQTIEYFIDSLTGRSVDTRTAYYRDLMQFKLYLVMHEPHVLLRGDRKRVAVLEEQLRLADGRLIDTRYQKKNYRTEARPRAILDEFDVDLVKISRDVIVGYFGYLETRRQLSRNTLNRRLASLRSFFRLLAKDRYAIQQDMLEKLNDLEIRRERTLPIALDFDEARQFLSVITNQRDRAIVLVMLYMGLRVSEVVRLNFD